MQIECRKYVSSAMIADVEVEVSRYIISFMPESTARCK